MVSKSQGRGRGDLKHRRLAVTTAFQTSSGNYHGCRSLSPCKLDRVTVDVRHHAKRTHKPKLRRSCGVSQGIWKLLSA